MNNIKIAEKLMKIAKRMMNAGNISVEKYNTLDELFKTGKINDVIHEILFFFKSVSDKAMEVMSEEGITDANGTNELVRNINEFGKNAIENLKKVGAGDMYSSSDWNSMRKFFEKYGKTIESEIRTEGQSGQFGFGGNLPDFENNTMKSKTEQEKEKNKRMDSYDKILDSATDMDDIQKKEILGKINGSIRIINAVPQIYQKMGSIFRDELELAFNCKYIYNEMMKPEKSNEAKNNFGIGQAEINKINKIGKVLEKELKNASIELFTDTTAAESHKIMKNSFLVNTEQIEDENKKKLNSILEEIEIIADELENKLKSSPNPSKIRSSIPNYLKNEINKIRIIEENIFSKAYDKISNVIRHPGMDSDTRNKIINLKEKMQELDYEGNLNSIKSFEEIDKKSGNQRAIFKTMNKKTIKINNIIENQIQLVPFAFHTYPAKYTTLLCKTISFYINQLNSYEKDENKKNNILPISIDPGSISRKLKSLPINKIKQKNKESIEKINEKIEEIKKSGIPGMNASQSGKIETALNDFKEHLMEFNKSKIILLGDDTIKGIKDNDIEIWNNIDTKSENEINEETEKIKLYCDTINFFENHKKSSIESISKRIVASIESDKAADNAIKILDDFEYRYDRLVNLNNKIQINHGMLLKEISDMEKIFSENHDEIIRGISDEIEKNKLIFEKSAAYLEKISDFLYINTTGIMKDMFNGIMNEISVEDKLYKSEMKKLIVKAKDLKDTAISYSNIRAIGFPVEYNEYSKAASKKNNKNK